MSFGYPSLYANGLNNNSQLRRSADMIYQRGGTYEVVLTGATYQPSMVLNVDMFSNNSKVGRMSVVPYNVAQSASTYTYRFNVRPYDYMSNYVETEHYQYYFKNNWYNSTLAINLNNPYPNIIHANYTYGYSFISGNTLVTEYTGSPTNNLNHYTDIPFCVSDTSFVPSGFTNTGQYFDYVGGQFQFEDRYILQNFDQEIGTVIGTGLTISTVDISRRLSPMSQYLMDYPTVPEMSATARFLTNAPRIQYVQSNDNYVLYYLNGQSGDRQVIEADFAVFEFYNESNTKLTGYTINQQLNFINTTYASPTGYTDTLQPFAIPCGPSDITNIFATIDWSTVAYYRVQLFYGWPTNSELRTSVGPVGPVSEEFFFYLKTDCGPQDTRLTWLNDVGGYDYFTFTRYRQDTKKITRQTYDNRYYATNLASPDRNIGRTVKTFDTDVDQEIVLESGYLNNQQGNWLESLFLSPQVYLMGQDFISPMDRQDKFYKDLTPLQVLSTEVQTITKKHQKLNKYRITLKTANTFFANKGF